MMKTGHGIRSWRARSRHFGLAACVCAAIGSAPVRGDEMGEAVLKMARWRTPTGRILALAAMSGGGGPIVAVGENDVAAFDRATGKPVWKVPESGFYVAVTEKTVLIRKEKKLTGLSTADGKVVFDIPFPDEYSFHAEYGVHVMGRVVVIQSNNRYSFSGPGNPPPGVPRTGGGAPVLTAYSLDTGKELWKNDAADNKNVIFGYGPLIEVTTSAGRNMVDPATGKVFWTYVPGKAAGRATLRNEEGTWLTVEESARGGPNSYKLVTRDSATGMAMGETTLENVTGTPTAATGQMLVMREARQSATARAGIDVSVSVNLTEDQKKDKYTAYDVKTGKVLWKAAVTVGNTNTRLRVVGDVLLAGDSRPEPLLTPHGAFSATALDAGTGKPLWSEQIFSDIAVEKDLLVYAVNDGFVGVKRREGKHVWSLPFDSTVQPLKVNGICSPLIADGVLYLAGIRLGNETVSGVAAIPLEGIVTAGKP